MNYSASAPPAGRKPLDEIGVPGSLLTLQPPASAREALEFLTDLLRIESVSGHEPAISAYLRDYLARHEFTVVPSRAGNAIGVKGQGSPTLLLMSHVDTVATDNPFRDAGDRLFATGAVDCKPALAAMFYAAAQAPWTDDDGTLIVCGVVHEEDETDVGMDDFFTHGFQPDYAVFGEPTNTTRVCLGYRGLLWIQLDVHTESGHSSSPWDYDNAVEIAYAVYARLKRQFAELRAESPREGHFFEFSTCLTRIHADTGVNSFPHECHAFVDIRIPPGFTADETEVVVAAEIADFERMTAFHRPTRIRYRVTTRYDPCEVPASAPVASALRWAIFQETRQKATLIKKTASTFMNLIQPHYARTNPAFACVVYGPGESHLAHTDHEYIRKADYLAAIRVYAAFLPKLRQLHESRRRVLPSPAINCPD